MAELSTDIIRKIRKIQIETNRLAAELLVGAYRSAFRGQGIEFEEVREYQTGDDVRSIDWNVSARMARPYIKNFREERELTILLMVDVSASSRFGSQGHSKKELIAEIAAALAFSAIKNNDNIGLILFSSEVEEYLLPKKGLRHVLRVIRELLLFEPKHKGTNIAKALSFLGNVQRRSAICFLISDFISESYSHEMILLAQKHDLISVCITDPLELALPNMNLAEFVDLESGKFITTDTSNQEIQKQFQLKTKQRIANVNDLMKKVGAGFIDIKTNESYMDKLRAFFKNRGRRR